MSATPEPENVTQPPQTIGEWEKLAGITDREAFWLPFAKYADGFERGVRTLKVMTAQRAVLKAGRA